MSLTLSALQKQRRDTAANWTAENPTLLAGEIGLESDTGYWKVGNGSSAWNSLAYVTGLGAEIPVNRLADGSARQLLQTAANGTDVEWTSNVDVPGTLDVTGAATFDAAVTIQGDLTVNGTTTTIDTQNLIVEDKNIIIGNVASPTDVTADTGGITLKGTTDKTIQWIDSTDAWTSSERFSVPLGTAGAPSLTFTGDTNTGIYSPGADQVAISTNGTGRLFVDSIGRILVGTSSARNVGPFAGGFEGLQFAGTTSSARVSLSRWDASTADTGVTLAKSRGGTIGTNGIISNGDNIGRLEFTGDDGTAFNVAVRILAQVDGVPAGPSPGPASMPGRIVFSTTPSGSTTPQERLRITSDGKVGVGTTSPGDLLHVSESSASAVAATGASVAQFERAGNVGITLSTADSGDATIFFGDTASPTVGRVQYGHSDNSLGFWANSLERGRIDSSGRLLVGTSTAVTGAGSLVAALQVQGTSGSPASALFGRWSADVSSGTIQLHKSRGASVGTHAAVVNNDTLGRVDFAGSDGSAFVLSARIEASVDGTPGTNDMPGRIVLSTTLDGASSPTERMRITNDGVMCYDQSAPVSYAAAATLVVGDLKNGLIQYTGAAATLTLPTGTLTEGGFAGIYTNMTFEWSVINTGSGTCTIGAGTDHTIVGGATVAADASGRFASRRTAANTFVSYRLS